MTQLSNRDQLIAEIEQRLRPLCADWPPDVFARMVQEMVEVRLKYEGKLPLGEYDRRSSERLIADLRKGIEDRGDGTGSAEG